MARSSLSKSLRRYGSVRGKALSSKIGATSPEPVASRPGMPGKRPAAGDQDEPTAPSPTASPQRKAGPQETPASTKGAKGIPSRRSPEEALVPAQGHPGMFQRKGK
jgi:hypothetical protein